MDNFAVELKKRIRIENVISETVALDGNNRRGYVRGAKKGVGEHGLVVDLDGQRFAWNGNADYGGGRYNDVIYWVMVRDRVDFKRAIETLAHKAGMELPKWSEEQQVKFAAVRKQEDVLQVAQRIFAEWLWKDEKILAYVRGRGWNDETIKKAGLGFTGWGTTAEYELMKNAIAATEDLHSAAAVAILGLRGGVKSWCEKRGIQPKSNWEEKDFIPSMMGWKSTNKFGLIYPCLYFGRTTYLYRRHLMLNDDGILIGSDEPKSYNLPEVLVGKRQLFFNHVYSPRAERVVLVEGPGDAVTLGQWGVDAVAIAGTAWGDHEAELRQLKDAKFGDAPAHEALYIALDADKAGSESVRGKNGEWPLVEIVGAMCRVIEWPEKDANEWLQAMITENVSHEDQVKKAGEKIGEAKPLAIEVAKWAGTQKDDHAQTKALKRAFQVIAQMGDENVVMRYASEFLKAFAPLGVTVKGVREFSRLLKAAMGKSEDGDEKKEDVIYTYGGRFGDWLLEYVYDPETKKARFAYRAPDGKVDEIDDLLIDGKRIKPMPPTDKMILKGAIVFPSGLARKADGSIDRRSTRELTEAIAFILRKNYLFRDFKWPQLAGYWTLGTWLYDNFKSLVYLRMVGDAGAGKSALLNLIGLMSYRSIKMSGADSEATFFRTVDDFRGTILFEEADLPDGSGADNPIVKFVNLGAMRGNFIYRMEEFLKPDGTKGWRPTPFETYCPKMFAMRGDFMDNAVASRSISIKLTSAETSELRDANDGKGIPLDLTDATLAVLRNIRNLCLTWRLHEYSLTERKLGWDLVDVEIPARFNQVTIPMKSLALNVDGTRDEKFLDQVTKLLREHYQEIIGDNSTTWEARVAEAAWKMFIYSDLRQRLDIRTDGTIYMKIGDVTAIANNIADEMNEQGADLRIKKDEGGEDGEGKKRSKKKDFELSAQRVGKIIRDKFQLYTPPRKGNGVFFEWDDMKMLAIGKKYGALPAEEKIEKARQEFAVLRAKTAIPLPLMVEDPHPTLNPLVAEYGDVPPNSENTNLGEEEQAEVNK